MKISGLILAAGLSGRMNSFKPLLKINEKTLIEVITEKLLLICNEVIIVTGYNNNLVEKSIGKSDRVKFVYNENYQHGMFTSLKKGLGTASDSEWVLYHFVDQPSLPGKFYYEFVKQVSNEYNWIQPAFNNVKGHPVLLHQSLFQIILNEDSASSLKNVSQMPEVKKKIWSCSYPQVFEDLDTKEDFGKIISQ